MAIHKLNDIKIRAKIREIEDLSYTSRKSALLGDGQGLTLAIAKNKKAPTCGALLFGGNGVGRS